MFFLFRFTHPITFNYRPERLSTLKDRTGRELVPVRDKTAGILSIFIQLEVGPWAKADSSQEKKKR
jgi:hypothetical protein